jgi:hypothetical protein
MKRFILFIFCAALSFKGFSQTEFGMYLGSGFTTSYNNGNTPTVGILYQTSPLRHIYVGGALFYESYSIVRDDDEFARFGGPGYRIKQNSSYLFVTPRFDVSVGSREHLHGYFSLGPGFFLSGDQNISVTSVPAAGVRPGMIYDSSNSSKNLNHLLFRLSIGVTWHFSFDNWDIIATPEWAIIPSWLSTNTYGYAGDAATNIKTNYISVTLGLLRKHNWSRLQPTRSWGGY